MSIRNLISATIQFDVIDIKFLCFYPLFLFLLLWFGLRSSLAFLLVRRPVLHLVLPRAKRDQSTRATQLQCYCDTTHGAIFCSILGFFRKRRIQFHWLGRSTRFKVALDHVGVFLSGLLRFAADGSTEIEPSCLDIKEKRTTKVISAIVLGANLFV